MKYYYSSSDYRRTAREALRNNWGMSVLVTLVAGLLGAGVNYGFSAASTLGNGANFNLSYQYGYGGNSWGYSANNLLGGVTSMFVIAALVYGVFCYIMGASVELGLNSYNTRLVQRVPQRPFSTLFERMSIFGRAIWLQLVMGFFIFLWSLLFIIPGIIAAYRYAMAPYLMAQNPNLTAMQAIEQSKQIMKGNKGRLFVLGFSFFGWALLAMFTCGIGMLFLRPYINASVAAFYLDVTNQLPAPNGMHNPGMPYGGQPYYPPAPQDPNAMWQQPPVQGAYMPPQAEGYAQQSPAQGAPPQAPAAPDGYVQQPPAPAPPEAPWQPPAPTAAPDASWQPPAGSPYTSNGQEDGTEGK